MVDYIATDEFGEFLMIGDVIADGQGNTAVFGGVVGQDPEGGGMLILANGRADYAGYWQVDVEEIADEFEDYVFYDDESDDYAGYDVRDEYYEDLYGEPYEDDDRY